MDSDPSHVTSCIFTFKSPEEPSQIYKSLSDAENIFDATNDSSQVVKDVNSTATPSLITDSSQTSVDDKLDDISKILSTKQKEVFEIMRKYYSQLETVEVRKIKPPTSCPKAPIISVQGPPGTGKTVLIKKV